MKRPRRSNKLAYALYANAAVLLGILLTMILGSRASLLSPAQAEPPQQAPIAGGNGIYVMPAQFHPSVWGCILMDVNRQTLCTYEYQAGNKALVLTASRNFSYDLQLKNLNTFPYWFDVKKLVDEQAKNEADGGNSVPTPPK